MEDRERLTAAREFNVRPESVDQIQALGIGDAETLALLGLRNEARLELPLGSGVQGVMPPVREITNTYLLFGGGEEGLASVRAVAEGYLKNTYGRFATGTQVPTSYREAQQLVTQGYQRALYGLVLGTHLLSPYIEQVEPSVVGDPLVGVMKRALGASGVAAADVILGQSVEAVDRFEAEMAVDEIIEAALRLPDDSIFLRTPKNTLVVLSKPDILLRFAEYRPGDEEFLAATRTAIANNNDPYRSAFRKLRLYYKSGSADDLFDAGMTAFTQARELIAAPTEGKIRDPERHMMRLFTVLHAVVDEQGRRIQPQSAEATTIRALLERATQLTQRDPRNSWIGTAWESLAALTGDAIDARRAVDPRINLDLISGERSVDELLEERLAVLARAMRGESVGPDRTEVVIDVIKLVDEFDDTRAKQAVLELDLSGFPKDRASRIRNALCAALIKHGDLDTATAVANLMTNQARKKEHLAQIEAKRSGA